MRTYLARTNFEYADWHYCILYNDTIVDWHYGTLYLVNNPPLGLGIQTIQYGWGYFQKSVTANNGVKIFEQATF